MGLLGGLIRSGVQAGAGAFRGMNAGLAWQQQQAAQQAQMERQNRLDAAAAALQQAQMAAMNQRATPQPVTLARGARLVGPDGRLIADNPEAPTPPAPRNIDPLSPAGIAAQIRLDAAKAKAGMPGGPQKPITEDQSKALGFVGRAVQAEQDLQGISPTMRGNFMEGLTSLPVVGSAFNGLVPTQQQQYEQAGKAFIAAVLRRESGAAISKDEYTSYGKIYLPQVGDSPEVLQQKARQRAIAIQALKQSTGGYQLNDPTGATDAGAPPTDAQAAFERYKARSGG